MAKNKVKIDLEIATKAAQKALENIEKQTNNTNKTFSVFAGNLASSLATAAISKAGSIISSAATSLLQFGKNSLDAASNMEDLETQFVTLTGSASQAKQIMSDLTTFSAQTPFQLDGLASTSSQLLSFGFDASELIPKLKALGDVAAASNTPLQDLGLIFGQVSAAGKLTGERLLQLQERGIPILKVLAETLGVAESEVRDLVSGGKVSFEDFERAFLSLSQEGGFAFDGMIAKSKTLSGIYSTLGDNWTLKSAEIGKSLLPIAKGLATVAIESIQAFDTKIIQSWITNGILLAIEGINKFTESINPTVTALRVVGNVFTIVVDSILAGFATIIGGTTGVVNSIYKVFGAIINAAPKSLLPESWKEENAKAIEEMTAFQESTIELTNSLAESMKTDFNDIGNAIDTNLIGEEKLEAFRARLEQAKQAVIINNKELSKEADKQDKANQKRDKEQEKNQKSFWQTHFGTAKEWKDATVAYENLKEQEKQQNLKSSLSAISTLTSSNNKDLFFIGKAAAVSQATIDGTAAVQKALASAPPPFNFALATLVGVATAANIAKIASAKPPKYKDGGIVPGASYAGDQVIARVNSGEMILNRQQQANLFNQINTPSGGNTEGLLIELISAVRESKSIQIDGREIVSVVRDELGRGRTLA